ncbi:FkbM family methyltransferase [Novosphingobium sp. JCM 18896]|uniref:FkbM family methyltransferase n=1 Tax=Novosphingobium sp. JCM 18896 TaxID=2989731 RepID=UPI0022222F38|nr:FkbM family methyltransferase [Novosphingobium sp. JCM 18896]MCW1429329.1 FkbM family methyltransferase [Novosphingobium sp. JCM 18896]
MTQSLIKTIENAASWADEHRSVEALRAVLAERGCYVYGAGGYGREVAAAVRGKGYVVHGFFDTFKGGGELVDGLPCRRPAELEGEAGAALIVAINNFKVPVAEVVAWARGVPFAEIIFVAELPDLLGRELGHYWQGERGLIRAEADTIARFHAMLGDARSREILEQLVRFRISGRPEDHPEVDRDHQYFPVDLPLPQTAISLVDCGAFPGDMLGSTAGAGLQLENWYAFEPDPANFRQLCEVAAGGGFKSGSLFPCGVGDATGLVRFAEGAADASRAMGEDDAGAGVVVPIVRVDDVVHADRIDMIKLDVEGFEAAAIDGMARLIGRHRPRLAIAIYHKPADLWELAFKIDGMFPGGRYAIRQHGYNGYDTVLYVDF